MRSVGVWWDPGEGTDSEGEAGRACRIGQRRRRAWEESELRMGATGWYDDGSSSSISPFFVFFFHLPSTRLQGSENG